MAMGAKYRLKIHKNILIVLMLMCSNIILAQTSESRKERWRSFEWRKPGILRTYTGLTAPPPERPDKFDRFNTDFFWNSWLGDVNGVKTKFYAIGHGINLMFDVPFDKKGRVGLGIGLGYSHFSVRTDGAFTFNPVAGTNDSFATLENYSGVNRWINRTVFDFVEVPFELRIRSAKERRKFKFYPGFKTGFMFEYFHKWRIGSDEFKEFNFPNMNRIHYGPTVRLGLDNVMLFAYYDLAPLFQDGASSQLQLFSLGLSFGWF